MGRAHACSLGGRPDRRFPAVSGDAPRLRLVDIDETIQDARSDQGRIAAGVREGRRRERLEQEAKAALLTAELAGKLSGMAAAHETELSRTAARERAIGHHRAAWLYGIPALLLGAAASVYAMMTMQDYTAATLAENFREQAMTGAIIQANQTPERCIPGERLQDGRVCPQP